MRSETFITNRMSCSTSTTVMPSRVSRRMMASISAVSTGLQPAALGGQVGTGDEMEQGGLAGAVGADDRKDEAGRDCQAHVFDRVHAAEGNREVLGNEDHARLKSSARASVGTMPARKKIITA